ncbi:MAG: BREX-4 system phosphatase PglZ [Synergistota bacterium]|nr:BREX-4 system phosphatase PglZ [Synergistota bacterium]
MSDIIAKIKNYFGGTSRYPLMAVVSGVEYHKIISSFPGVHRIKVSDYCVGADKEPDIAKLQKDVEAFKGNSLLLGLGDYLACKGDRAKNLLAPYKALVLQPQSYVAIILSAHMYPVVKNIVSEDLRAKSRVILPVNVPEPPSMNNNAFVHGIKAYLDASERGEPVGKVKTALRVANATVIDPENAYDELKYKFPNEFNKLSQANGTYENWSRLLTEVSKGKKNILQYLADQKFTSPEYIFLKYAKANDYKSWLFFIWLKLNFSSKTYLGLVVSQTDTIDNLFETAKTAILDIGVSDSQFSQFYEQRKTLLKGCSDADMANFIPQIYRQGADRIAYLTDNTKREKQEIIVSLGEGAKADYLETSYPALYAYLKDYCFADDYFTAYFAAYKKCKVYNKINESFAEMVSKNATSRPYNALPSITSIFSDLDSVSTLLIFLDAMGVEFLGYVKEVCAELKLRFVANIARANLPTITGLNRVFYDDWEESKEPPIKDIDDLKHNPERGYDFNNSPYPIHLTEELDAVRSALERAAIKLRSAEYRKVIIASDHGASRLAVISPDVKIDCGDCEPKSSGRYCQGGNLPMADNIAIENDYAVVADYSRFNGSRSASVEVHGGATLEEVVVPIIELTLANKDIRVTIENSVIEISYKKAAELILIITPDCDAVTVSVNGAHYGVEELEKSRFKVVMPDLKKGTYIIDVFENQNKIASKEFTIKSKGFAERDYF